MKVIKHLKEQTPQQRIKNYCKSTPFLTRIIIPLIIIVSIILLITSYALQDSFFSIIIVLPTSQLILFTLIAISDIRREQFKGTIYFFIEYMLITLTILLLNSLFGIFTKQIVFSIQFSYTSIPLQYLIVIAFIDGFQNKNTRKHLIIQPFSLRAIAYPFFIISILILINLRIDILLSLIVAIAFYLIGIRNGIKKISKKIDQYLGQQFQSICLIRTEPTSMKASAVQKIQTSNSIVLEQK